MRKLVHAIALLLVRLSAPVPPAPTGPYEDGLAAWDKNDFATAMRLWRPLADQGDVRAQFHLAIMYKFAKGVPQDYVQTAKWYRLAADQGDVRAQLEVGIMYENGQGVPQDFALACKYYGLAADQGDVRGEAYINALYCARAVPRYYRQPD